MPSLSPFGESSLTIVAATYRDGHAADRAARLLEGEPDLAGVSVLSPNDPQADDKLNPEPDGVARTLLRAHVVLGAAGVLGGLLAALLLAASGWPPATTTPLLMTLFLAASGLFLGLVLGALVALRPDRAWLVDKVREAGGRHLWTVIAHPTSRREARRVWWLLRRTGARTLRTL